MSVYLRALILLLGLLCGTGALAQQEAAPDLRESDALAREAMARLGTPHESPELAAMMERAIALRQAALHTDDVQVARLRDRLGWFYNDLGKWRLAEEQFRLAEHIADVTGGPAELRGNIEAHLAEVLFNEYRLADALQAADKSLEIRRPLVPPNPEAVSFSLQLRGQIHERQGDYAAAVADLTEATNSAISRHGVTSPQAIGLSKKLYHAEFPGRPSVVAGFFGVMGLIGLGALLLADRPSGWKARAAQADRVVRPRRAVSRILLATIGYCLVVVGALGLGSIAPTWFLGAWVQPSSRFQMIWISIVCVTLPAIAAAQGVVLLKRRLRRMQARFPSTIGAGDGDSFAPKRARR